MCIVKNTENFYFLIFIKIFLKNDDFMLYYVTIRSEYHGELQ